MDKDRHGEALSKTIEGDCRGYGGWPMHLKIWAESRLVSGRVHRSACRSLGVLVKHLPSGRRGRWGNNKQAGLEVRKRRLGLRNVR